MYNYCESKASIWSGRVDSIDNPEAFRIHQMIQCCHIDDLIHLEKKTHNFAIVGFESDLGVKINQGRVGASEAPNIIRSKIAPLPWKFEDVNLVDVGNVYSSDNLTKAQKSLGEVVTKIIKAGYFPLVLGGGHETALGHYYGNYNATSDNIGIVNLDAHFDNRPYEETGPCSGTMFRQIYDLLEDNHKPYNYMVLGIQDHANTTELFNYADKTKTKYIYADQLDNFHLNENMTLVDEFIDKVDQIMLTIDMDVFNISIAPGVSATQPFGVFPEQIMPYVKRISQSGKLSSIDVVEVSPPHDINNNQTSTLAAIFLYYLMKDLVN